MPWILIALAVGLLAAGGAVVYVWKHPVAAEQPTDGTALLVLGFAFTTGGVVFILTHQEWAYSWVPIGIVFLGVGARQRRLYHTRH
jgi:hypothetical protein